MNKAIFIDKDGTLIPDVPYNVNPDLIHLELNCVEGLKRLQNAGYLLVIISNQSGVARGYFKEDALAEVEMKLKSILTNENIQLNGFYYCPHHTEGTVSPYSIECLCRKPLPGLILKAAEELSIDLKHSWMIGDILNDIEAGNRAGCKTILIDNGNETEWLINDYRVPYFRVKDINQAADKILLSITNNRSHA
ncbi:MAG: hydrolase, HAD-superfamily, subfamily [Sphingobacteriales bacterium]|nr:hydrolase, HAD-superfamily, subfamily [Sphingobacteriales bacterium]